MKKIFFLSLIFGLIVQQNLLGQNFKFAQVSDTHIGSSENAKEDLERTVKDINLQSKLDFVLVTGDITEMGTDKELATAKDILEKINIPYYVVPGNHDTGWSESGGVTFIKEFGYDKFVFEHKGYKFVGCASGPYVRMSDGHIPRDAIVWLDSVLAKTPKDERLVFINHYPIDKSLDNWYEAIDRLKKYETQFALCGHGHRNKAIDFEGIPGTMGRSNLRAKDSIGGYNIVEVSDDRATFSERKPGVETLPVWRTIPLGKRDYERTEEQERPSYAVNDCFPQVSKVWDYHSSANVISTPAVVNNKIIFGNSTGTVEALALKTGEKEWEFRTDGGIFSSPAIYKTTVILGSGDGTIYALDSQNGSLKWKTKTGASVLGSPLIKNGIVYIGGSDDHFRALDTKNGKELWSYDGLQGPVVSQPLFYKNKVIFGAWDKNLYALNAKDGNLAWKWTNGKATRMFSPAMVIPVATDGVVYIVAPDRYMTAINAETGKTLWRTDRASVRESLGISENKKLLYAKTMNDTLVAFKTTRPKPVIAWKLNLNYGYDHVPSMLTEKNGEVYFGGRNGVVFSIDPKTKTHNWSYKIDNSMVNTVNVLNRHQLVAATMDGKITLLQWK